MIKNLFLFSLLVATLCAGQAAAANIFIHQWHDRPQVFTLELQQTDVPVRLGTHDSDMLVQRLRGELMDISNPLVHGGIILGKLRVDQDNYPPAEGITMDGYFIGFGLRHHRPLPGRWQFAMQAEYLYQTAEGDSGSQAAKLAWHQWQGRAGVMLTLGSSLSAYGGGELRLLRGQSIYNQPSSQTDPLDETYFPNGFIGLDLRVENTGHIGLEALLGENAGLSVYFQRQY